MMFPDVFGCLGTNDSCYDNPGTPYFKRHLDGSSDLDKSSGQSGIESHQHQVDRWDSYKLSIDDLGKRFNDSKESLQQQDSHVSFRQPCNEILKPPPKRNLENKKNVTETELFELRISKKICQPLFTGEFVKGEDGQPLMVSLINSQTGQLVTSGPEASARVEIVVLEEDFGEDSWTREMFKSKIVTRVGHRPYLTENVMVDLKEGIGCVGILGFSRTRIYKRKSGYRLGAIVLDVNMGTKIKEGFTDPFIVKDGNLNYNKKHYPPTPSCKVYRLVNIGKNGPIHHRLSVINVNNVEDFVRKLDTNPRDLRDACGKGMSAMKWETLVAHARTCKFDKSHKFSIMESSSGTKIQMSPTTKELGFSEQPDSFNSEQSSVDNSSQGNGIYSITYQKLSPIHESSSGSEILKSLEVVELDSRNSVLSQKCIVSDLDKNMLQTGMYHDHGGLEHEGHERHQLSPADILFTTNKFTLESPDYPQMDMNGPIEECERFYKHFFSDWQPMQDENISSFDHILQGTGHGTQHNSSAWVSPWL